MSSRIPLASPDIRDTDIARVVETLKSGQLVQGSQVKAFEGEIAEWLDVPYVYAVSSGTAALHVALLAAEVGPGDEVIVPALSYIATANVVEMVGAKPVFVDVDESSFCIDTSQIEKALTSATKAILPVHEFGLMADMSKLLTIAGENGLLVIEDGACALGSLQDGKQAGTLGDFGTFSLHPRKNITSGEGGIVVCKTEESAKKIQCLRNHGFFVDEEKRGFIAAGLNYRLTDFQAALVRGQFERYSESLAKRRKLAEIYEENLISSKVLLPEVSSDRSPVWQSYHVLLADEINRNQIITELRAQGIESNLGAQCMPAQDYYFVKYQLDSASRFPNAYRAQQQGLVLPLYERLEESDIVRVAEKLNRILGND